MFRLWDIDVCKRGALNWSILVLTGVDRPSIGGFDRPVHPILPGGGRERGVEHAAQADGVGGGGKEGGEGGEGRKTPRLPHTTIIISHLYSTLFRNLMH